MRLRNPVAAFCLLACSAIGFGAETKPAAKTAEAKPAAHAKPGAKTAALPSAMPAPVDPVVEAILATNPTQPDELLRAAKILASVKPDLARKFLGQLLQAKLSDAEWAELSEKFGQGAILQLADQQNLLPEARRFADRILKATAQHVQNPERLSTLAKQLAAESADARREALVEFAKAGSAGAASLVAVLADPQLAKEHAATRAALAQLGVAAMGPLTAAIDSSIPALAVEAVQTMAMLKSPDAKLFLAAPRYAADSPAEVRKAAGDGLATQAERLRLAELLAARAREYAAQRIPFTGAVDGKIDVWRWDAAKKQVVARLMPVEDASRTFAARMARDAHRLVPDDRSMIALHLAVMLEAASYAAGLDNPLSGGPGSAADEAAQFDLELLQAALAQTIEIRHWAGATALVRILAAKGKADQLLDQGHPTAVLVQAVRQPDRRLRMAAADAIVNLKPTKAFAGSSYLVESLAFLAASSGRRCVVVGGPKSEDAMRFAGGLTEDGYAIDVATSGQDFLRLSFNLPDYEFALIDVGIDHPTADVIVQRLRQDCRTALMPVGLIARDGFLERAEHIASTETLTKAFPRPHDAAGMKWEASQLRALAPTQFVPLEVRQQQAVQALRHLATLSTARDLYDLRRIEAAAMAAITTPHLTIPAVSVIGNIGTPECQRALVELASRPVARIEDRQAASRAFLENTWRFGVLLTHAEIVRQYDRYNNSEKQDPATQRILGSILDSLEARAETNKLGVGPGMGGAKTDAAQGSRP
jgi:hypothetical protein